MYSVNHHPDRGDSDGHRGGRHRGRPSAGHCRNGGLVTLQAYVSPFTHMVVGGH
ncbi:hypothetical protein ACIOV9_04420 [Pseudomonas iridis]|uniref:hypothetical protein n=1 Tax=Pseudomonas iridis TaxID=2710587 RepID=UPI0037FFA649